MTYINTAKYQKNFVHTDKEFIDEINLVLDMDATLSKAGSYRPSALAEYLYDEALICAEVWEAYECMMFQRVHCSKRYTRTEAVDWMLDQAKIFEAKLADNKKYFEHMQAHIKKAA